MRKFPGRLPEEFDLVNWPRLMRAMEADDIMRIEEVREMQIRKKTKPSASDWKRIQQHDELYRAARGDSGTSLNQA
jgi:hypothetical protein